MALPAPSLSRVNQATPRRQHSTPNATCWKRTLLDLAAVLLLLAVFAGSASATNTGAPPQLVPYEMRAVAGNASLPFMYEVGGYGGDGLLGGAATLSSPNVLAVDSAGNVYFADDGNALIREVNAQTGIITTVVGQPPSGCVGTICARVNSGCSEAVAAAGNPIGGNIQGIAVDAYGNLYFSDNIAQTISVIYRAGAQVAAFIRLVDPTGVATSNGVQPGFVYHVAGSINLTSCAGTASAGATSNKAAVPAGDGQLAYNGGTSAVTVTFGTVQSLGLDSAGNLYIGDGSPNNVIRVINTQATAQTFFGVTVQPGYIASIVNCGSLTVACPANAGNMPETVANTGIGGPAGAAVFNSLATGEGNWMSTDAYGNIYELNYKGATPAINLGVAYAGGTALGKLINNANAGAGAVVGGTISGAAQLPSATPGDFYYLLADITLRPSSVTADPYGNVYYEDNHNGQIYRIDANATAWNTDFVEVSFLTSAGNSLTNIPNRVTFGQSSTSAGTLPAFCYPVSGQSISKPIVAGYITPDDWGSGCPAIVAMGTGVPHMGTGYGTVMADGPGNLYIADRTNDQIRSVTLNNIFPTTPVGQQWNPTTFVGEQGLQAHFDQSNLPIQATSGFGGTLTTSFSIAPGSSDFTINPIETQYSTATASGLSVGPTAYSYTLPLAPGTVELPACANVTGSVDLSLDCVLNVIFSPTLPGLRQSQLVVTTANGSVYNFGLSGVGTGPQLAIDGGAQTVVPVTGLGNPAQIAVTQQGNIYIADPANNQVVVETTSGGSQTTVGTGLKGPMGVAVDASGNVFIADTGNNRVVEISQATGVQTVLGQILAAGTPAYTSYSFKAPQSIAVDLRGNVYVADTGNAKVVEIPSDPKLGGATPLLQYPNAPALSKPVAVALDVKGNVYIADAGNIQIFEVPAGGGDLQTLPGSTLTGFGSSLTSPSGVAVDAAGDIYVSDSGTNQVYELPSAIGLAGVTLPINFTGLNLTGASPSVASFSGGSLALDANSNLYLADSGNGRILFENRQNPTVACGLVAQDQRATTCGGAPLYFGANTLTITNIGNQSATIGSPFTSVTSSNAAFSLTNNCASLAALAPGSYCTISPTFLPPSDGAQSETFTVNGNSAQTVTLTGTGEQPLVKLVLSNTPITGSGVAGTAITVTATLTQPNTPPGGTPTGTVSFSYTDNGGAPVVTPATVSGSGGTSTASFTIPGSAVLPGHHYVVNATYQGDSLDSPTVATPLSISAALLSATLALTANPPVGAYDQPFTLIATLTPPAQGPNTDGETITFIDVATVLGTATLSSGVATLNFSSNLDSFPAGTNNLYASYAGDTNFASVKSNTLSYTVTQATPVVTWSPPAAAVYTGQAINPAVFNASSTTPGSFLYTFTPAGGSATPVSPSQILPVGSYTLNAVFTPTDKTDFTTVSKSAPFAVTPATLTVTPANATRAFGAANPAFMATIAGALNSDAFTVTGATTATPASPVGTYPITYTVSGANIANYTVVSSPGTLTITQATPTIAWASPAAITYGTALSSAQLNATASAPGTFVYTPAAGAVPTTGADTLSVTFTPTDAVDYATATQSVSIVVNQATPTVLWSPPTSLLYTGMAINAQVFNASSITPGSFGYTFTPAGGSATLVIPNEVLPVGSYTLTAVFSPSDTRDYKSVTLTTPFTVTPATLTVVPSIFTRAYGAANPALTASVTGALNMDVFTVTGTTTATPASPVGTYPITYAVSGANIANYTVLNSPGTLTIAKATPAITWPSPAAISYGTALSPAQLNATASTPGTFTYTAAAGTVLGAGTQTISVTFTPTDTADYAGANDTVTLTVNKAALAIGANNAARVFGAANPAFTGAVTGALNGDTFTEAFSTTATAASTVGSYPIVPSVTGTNSGDYTVTATNGALAISPAGTATTLALSNQNLTLTANVASLTSGVPTGTVGFYEGQTLVGTGTLSNGIASYTSSSFPVGDVTVSAQYSGDVNFTQGSSPPSFVLSVSPATTSLTVARGSSVTDTLSISVAPGYAGTVLFSCTGLPLDTVCNFQPASVVFTGTNSTASITMTIQTNTTASIAPPSRLPIGGEFRLTVALALLWMPGLLVASVARPRRRISLRIHPLHLVLLLGCLAVPLACGSSSPSSSSSQTPSGTSTIQVVANGSAGLSQATNVTLVVQ